MKRHAGSDIYEIGHTHEEKAIYLLNKFTSMLIIDMYVFTSLREYIPL